MPVGTQQHGTDTTYSDYPNPATDNAPTTLPSNYAGAYSAADILVWPSGGILTTATLEDLRKGTNQFAKDFNTAIVSHQAQITDAQGDISLAHANLVELKTDSIEIATDLSNKAWDTITIVPGTGLTGTGTSHTSDLTGTPSGFNLKSDLKIDLQKANTTEIGGVLSTDSPIGNAGEANSSEGAITGHIFVNASTGKMKVLNNAIELSTHTRGNYIATITPAAASGAGNVIENILVTGGSGEGAPSTLDLTDSGVVTSLTSLSLNQNSFVGTSSPNTPSTGITTISVPKFKVDKKGRIYEVGLTSGQFATNESITINGGTNLSVSGGSLTSNSGQAQSVTINHDAGTLSAGEVNVGKVGTRDTSNAGSGNGSFGSHHKQVRILDNIELDAQGHVVAVTTRPITYGLDSPKGGVDGDKYTQGQDFDLHVPTEKDFQSLQLQVNTIQGGVVVVPTIASGDPIQLARDTIAENDLTVSNTLVVGSTKNLFKVDFTNDRVGVGTLTPGRKLDVVGTGRFSGALEVGGDFSIANKIVHTGDSGNNTSIGFTDNDTFDIITGGQERLRVVGGTNDAVKVGIGTTSPAAALHINKDGNGIDLLTLGGNIGTSENRKMHIVSPATASDNDAFKFVTGNSFTFRVDTEDVLNIEHDRNVGIGTTSPTGKLHVSNVGESRIDIEDTDGTGNQKFRIFVRNSDDTFAIYDGTNQRTWFRYIANSTVANQKLTLLEGNGNVGIRTTNPSYALDVNGTIRSQSTLRAATNLIVGTTIQAASGNFDVDSSGNISDVGNIVSGGDISATGDITSSSFIGVGTSDKSSDTIEIDGTNETFGPYAFHVSGDSKLGGDVNITGKLAVEGVSSLSGNVDYDNVSLTEVNGITMSGILDVDNNTGSSSSTSGAVQVTGGVGIGQNLNVGGNTTLGNSTSDTTTIKGSLKAGNDGFDVDSSGNITDVGSIAAGGKIIINGVSSTIGQTTATNGALQIINGSANLAFDSNEIFSTTSLNVGVADGKDIFFLEGDDPHMVIKDGGNVGIGIGSPTEELHIYGNSNSAAITALIQNQGSFQTNLKLKNSEGQFALLTDGGEFKIHDDGDATPATRLTIDTSGNVGIGTTSPDSKLEVAGNIKSTGRITGTSIRAAQGAPNNQDGSTVGFSFGDDGDTGMFSIGTGGAAGGDIAFFSNNSRKVTIESGTGNVGIGVTDPATKLDVRGQLLIENTSDPAVMRRYVANSNGPFIFMDKSRNAFVGQHTIVESGDALGGLLFRGSDGSGFEQGARIRAIVDGTPGSNDMPGRLEFATTPDGGTSPSTRMTIKNNGNVGINTTSPAKTLDVVGPADISGNLHVGRATGGIALTLNDGHGNANIAFNHESGVPSQNGSCARIETTVDSTTGQMIFEVGDDAVSGSGQTLTPVMQLKTDGVFLHQTTSVSSNLTIKSNATHLGFNASGSDTELANILMDNSSGLEISVTSSNANAKRIRMRPGNVETWVFGVNASTTVEKIICNDTTAGSQNDGAIHTNGGISANSDLHIGGGTPTIFADVSKGCTVFGGTSASDDTRVRIKAAGDGVANAIQLENADSDGTACRIKSFRGLVLSADTENNSGEAESFISMETDGEEVFKIAGNGVSTFDGAVKNVTKTVSASGSDVTLDLRETNVFIINVTANTIIRASNEGSVPGAAYTFIFKNQGNHDINFGGEFYFTGGDPVLTTGGSSSSPKIDLVSGVCDGTNIYCAMNFNLLPS